jgi:hypothetical protein
VRAEISDAVCLDSTATMLYETGTRLLTETMKSEHLTHARRCFLNSWAERLKAMGEWVMAQREAGELGAADILACVQLDVEVAQELIQRP